MLIYFNNAYMYIVQALTAGTTEIAFYRPVLECGALIVKTLVTGQILTR